MAYTGKRGQALENMIIQSNEVYKHAGRALIQKIPTPWNVTYDRKSHASKAFPAEKSTVDFIGVSQGRSLAFDAKSTEETTRLPLNIIKEHQVTFLRQHQDQGGVSFLIIEFSKRGEVYLLPIKQLLPFWTAARGDGRKSIPYEWFVVNTDRVTSRNGAALDYLRALQLTPHRLEVNK